jgi:hypothetical protein
MPIMTLLTVADMPHTHHHSLQHRSVTNLQVGEFNGPSSATGNYSRTPELRISHKMAERKRRSEMKNLFDELNGILPSTTGGKSSKWETLTRSIEYIQKIKSDSNRHHMREREGERRAHDLDMRNQENHMMREEILNMRAELQRLNPSDPHVYGNFTNQLAQEQGIHNQQSRPPLPPIGGAQSPASGWAPPTHSQGPHQPGSQAMQGVEYGGNGMYGVEQRR